MIGSLTRTTLAVALLLPCTLIAQRLPSPGNARLRSMIADTIRVPANRTAAQNPPYNEGLTQGVVLLHSGELVVSTIDLDAGGRNGLDVVIDRTYRSGTLMHRGFGRGWSSSIDQRLRLMPDGRVEYRDATGEMWTFTPTSGANYISPPGLMLRLSRVDMPDPSPGWILSDTLHRRTYFDELGRLTKQTDEFFHPYKPNTGSTIYYLYGRDGRLQWIRDPRGRDSRLDWYQHHDPANGAVRGLIASVTDWRGRRVTYHYDADQRLREVRLPAVEHVDGAEPPTIRYEYEDGNGSYNDRLEIADNLRSITDPTEVAKGGPPRVTFLWGSGATRDRVVGERWATGETVSYTYVSETEVHETDALGQLRLYTIAGKGSEAHIATIVDRSIDVAAELGVLPASTAALALRQQDRVTRFDYNPDGTILSVMRENVRMTTWEWGNPGYEPGRVIKSVRTEPAGSASAMSSAQSESEFITETYSYQTEATAGGALRSIAINGVELPSPQPHRGLLAPTVTVDEITSATTLDAMGRPLTISSSGGTDQGSAGSTATVEYYEETAPHYARGEVRRIDRGGLVTRISYEPARTTIDSPDGVKTVVDFDAWRRPVKIERSGLGVVTRERYRYDASGRVTAIVRTQGGRDVTTSYMYDALGRETSVTIDHVATPQGTLTSSTQYDLPNHRLVTTTPQGAVVTRTIDSLGRVSHEHVTTGGTPIEIAYAYDLDDNLVWTSDGKVSLGRSFDAHGRERQTRNPDGTIVVRSYDAAGNLDRAETLAADGATVIHSTDFDFTTAGRLESVTSNIDDTRRRETSFAWDGAGRVTAAASEGFAVRSSYDEAGRWRTSTAGAGSLSGITDAFTRRAAIDTQPLPHEVAITDRSGATTNLYLGYDTNHNVTTQFVGELEWDQRFDESGNLVSATPPRLGTTEVTRDSLGAATTETLPSGHSSNFTYDDGGALETYVDPAGETAVRVQTDLLGRPTVRTYADGTTERITWDGTRIGEITDRQNRTRVFDYNGRGQLTEVRSLGGEIHERLAYDDAGRLTMRTTRDASIEYAEFNRDGLPGRTIVTRYRDGGAFTTPDAVVGRFVQEHEWNERGERVGWTMPLQRDAAAGPAWTRSLTQTFDAAGNLESIERTREDGTVEPLLTARFRGAGRPESRSITTSCVAPCAPALIERDYSYDPSTRLSGVTVRSRDLDVAGSEITSFRGLLIASERMVGVPHRTRSWQYDDRGRVESSELTRRVDESIDPAEFREAVIRDPRIFDVERERLAAKGIDANRIDRLARLDGRPRRALPGGCRCRLRRTPGRRATRLHPVRAGRPARSRSDRHTPRRRE